MRIGIVIYPGFDELDAIGPYEVFRMAANSGADVDACLITHGPAETVEASYGLTLMPQGQLDDGWDLIVVPGGGWANGRRRGVRREVRRGELPTALAELHTKGTLMASVGTGAMLLSAAELTHGRPVTTHYLATKRLKKEGVEIVDARIVDDGDIISAGGVTSGIDLALWIVEREWGSDLADQIARDMEHRRVGPVHVSASASVPQPKPSLIVGFLNREVGRYHRWCTPSILTKQEYVEDFYASDVSVSFTKLGSLLDHTGDFGKAEKHAAEVYGADRMMFSVHGSSGSNFIVIRMLALIDPDSLVLVARNVHHSVINALKLFKVNFRFLPGRYVSRFEALLPPSAEDVHSALDRYSEAVAVIYTSPSYEGLTADTERIAEVVHEKSEEAIVVVDEAWGGHLHFHPDLPEDAMAARADVSLQSSHKCAGGLQQTGTIFWKTDRVKTDLMLRAYREYVTTSPSYHLVGSADAAIRALDANGKTELDRSIRLTEELKGALRRRLPNLDIMEDTLGLGTTVSGHSARYDRIKTTCGLSHYNCSGFFISDELVKKN